MLGSAREVHVVQSESDGSGGAEDDVVPGMVEGDARLNYEG